MHLPSRLSYYLAFLGLWIIVWLWFTLKLILTYKWVHIMVVLWVWITSFNHLLANFMLPFLTAIIHCVHVKISFVHFSACSVCVPFVCTCFQHYCTLLHCHPLFIPRWNQYLYFPYFSFGSLFSYVWLEGCLESGIFRIYTVHYSNYMHLSFGLTYLVEW